MHASLHVYRDEVQPNSKLVVVVIDVIIVIVVASITLLVYL